MALNSQYMLAVSLQELFRDKTGAPLAGGYVYFYRDSARTQLKTVYTISGSAPNYTYVPLPNPVPLTAAGTFSDGNNNDIVAYYYPYDNNNNVDLYYVVVTDSSNSLSSPVFTRQAWPNFIQQTDSDEIAINYIPNGQFLSHTNVPVTDTTVAGQITQPITNIAYGGWTFERPSGSSATDIVTFQRAGGYVTNPAQNPRYSLRINTQSPSTGDSYKDVRIKFSDVNKFASATDQYTIAFNGNDNAGGGVALQLILIKNFGTGGDATTAQTLTTFNINGANQQYVYSFSFGDNNNKIIGTQDDDYIQLALRCPLTTVFDVSLTDFILTPGVVTAPTYPVTTTRQNQYRSITPPIPATDGSDLYLPLRLTPNGLEYDDSDVGKIFFASYGTPAIGELACIDAQFETAAYSTDGIPYSRLQKKIWNPSVNLPIWGTGQDYMTGIGAPPETTNALRIATNKPGSVTNASDGTAPNATGFTFNTIHTGSASYYMKSYFVGTQVYVESQYFGQGNVGAGTSGFTVGVAQAGQNLYLPTIIYIAPIAASTLASKYFTIDWINPSIAPINFYVWFKVDGSGTDPAVASRTGIEVDLTSADTPTTVSQKIRESLNGWQLTNILMTAGSSITAGSYFNINTINQAYYVWYKKDGVGTDPKPTAKVGIEVDIASTDTAAQVVVKTQIAINMKYFSTPDLRGYIIRGVDNGAGVDVDAALRYSTVYSGYGGDALATYQNSANLYHKHNFIYEGMTGTAPGSGSYAVNSSGSLSQDVSFEGDVESRPKNVSLNYVIKY